MCKLSVRSLCFITQINLLTCHLRYYILLYRRNFVLYINRDDNNRFLAARTVSLELRNLAA